MAVKLRNKIAKRMPLADALERYQSAKNIKLQWDALLQDVYEYFLPNRNLYYTSAETEGQHKHSSKVYDSTSQHSILRAASRLQSTLTPPFTKWCGLKAGPMAPDDLHDEINQRLEPIETKLFGVIHASNFDTAINEVFIELLIGTACLLVEEGDIDHPVMYIAVPMPQVCFELNAWGMVSGVFRTHKMKIRHIQERWPDIKQLPADLSEMLKSSQDATTEILEYTYETTLQDGTKAAVYQLIVHEKKIDLHHRVYKRMPWVTPRWLKVAGETYGRGPAVQALPYVKVQNKIVELILRNAALHVGGVYTYTDQGVLNPAMVKIFPGAMIQVASNGGARGPSLQPLQRSGDIGVGMELNENFIMQIKKLMLDDSLPPDAGPVRSATEILARIRELARDIGSPFGRMMPELIVPIVRLTLDIMAHRRLINPIHVDGLGVRVAVQSPLAQEQKIAEVESIVQWLSVLAQYGPETLSMAAKIEEIGPFIGERLGVPASLIRTKAERAKMKQAFAESAAKQMGIEGGAGMSPVASLPSGTPANGLPQLPQAA